MTKNRIILIITVFIVLVLALSFLKGSNLVNKDILKRQLSGIEILETQDLSTNTPRFKLHVQTVPEEGHTAMNGQGMGHSGLTAKPERILLLEKDTKRVRMELPLIYSPYQNECIAHHHLLDTVEKWDTDWFTIPDLNLVDKEYASKLSNTYSVEIVYNEGSTEKLISENMVGNVCYQTTESVLMTPRPEDTIPER